MNRCITIIGTIAAILVFGGVTQLASAKVSPCEEGSFSCTQAQYDAWASLNALNVASRVTDDGSFDISTLKTVYQPADENDVASYRNYLTLIVQGYTVNDQELLDAIELFPHWITVWHWDDKTYPELITFGLNDVYPEYDAYSTSEMPRWSVGDRGILEKFRKPAVDCSYESSYGPICPPPGDDIIADIFDASSRDDLFVESGFRVTYYRGLRNSDPTRFGIWAKDSFWGFAELLKSDTGGVDYERLSRPYGWLHEKGTVFFADGRNPNKPISGNATWNGMAVARSYYFPEVRVGHSRVVANFDTSEVDVDIWGLKFGMGIAVNEDDLEIADSLSWKGLALAGSGGFSDYYRPTGVITQLDDAFPAELPRSGEYFSDTAFTISGQFFGDSGDEVVGIFDKNSIYGSFGAYR